MLDGNSKSLITVVKNQDSFESIKEIFLQGAIPDIVDEKVEYNALQHAILNNDLDIVSLFLEGIKKDDGSIKTAADINLVGHSFEPNIVLATKVGLDDLQDKVILIKKIIENRKLFNEKIFDKYLSICTSSINNRSSVLKKSDFSLLAHYVSRLCNCNIGDILNAANNDDRYLVHLCDYSDLGKDGIHLKSWRAEQFLPLRIFSLFEILVKINNGIIKFSHLDPVSVCRQIRKEILIEIETLRLTQERLAIANYKGLYTHEREELYGHLAETFLSRVINNSDKEFSIESGYDGHTIYISFHIVNNVISIRYDNLGEGIEEHHLKDKDNMILPKLIKIENFNKQNIEHFIKRLFQIKQENLKKNIFTIVSEKIPFESILRKNGAWGKFPLLIKSKKDSALYFYWKCYGKIYRKILNTDNINVDGWKKIEFIDSPKEYCFDQVPGIIKDQLLNKQKEALLNIIYDIDNTLKYSDVKNFNDAISMKKQIGNTCVVTSHQVGLLSRCKDESLYKWIVSEEKRCIVQADRNEASLKCSQKEFWNIKIDKTIEEEFKEYFLNSLIFYRIDKESIKNISDDNYISDFLRAEDNLCNSVTSDILHSLGMPIFILPKGEEININSNDLERDSLNIYVDNNYLHLQHLYKGTEVGNQEFKNALLKSFDINDSKCQAEIKSIHAILVNLTEAVDLSAGQKNFILKNFILKYVRYILKKEGIKYVTFNTSLEDKQAVHDFINKIWQLDQIFDGGLDNNDDLINDIYGDCIKTIKNFRYFDDYKKSFLILICLKIFHSSINSNLSDNKENYKKIIDIFEKNDLDSLGKIKKIAKKKYFLRRL